MQRPLIPLVVSYIYGIVAAELFRYFPVMVVLVSIAISLTLTLSPKGRGGREGRPQWSLLSIVIIAAITGFFYMLYDSRVPQDDISFYATGEKMTIIGMLDEPAKYASQKVVAHLRAMKIIKGERELDVSGRVRVSIYDPEVVLSYGDIIKLTGRLKRIRGFKNPGLFDYARYIAREGIRASVGVGKKENISKAGTGGSHLLRRIYGWREEIRLAIVRGLSGPSSTILQAMVIGATGDLTPEVRDKFTAAGITHILSISGSHLGFVTFLAFFIIRYTLVYLPCRILLKLSLYMIPSKMAALSTFPLIIFYTLISGGEIATVRSLIMAVVYLTAILIEREDDAINTLVVAVLLVLLWNPQALFDISFQLSYTAVLSMIIVTNRFDGDKFQICSQKEEESGWGKRYWKRFIFFVLLTLGATISTAPIVAHYYNQFTWVGLISNLVIVPFVGFAVLPVGLFTCLLALISHAQVIPLAWLNDLLLSGLYRLVEFFAQFPLSVIYLPSPRPLLIFSIGLFSLSLFFLRARWAKISLCLSISLLILSPGCNPLIKDKKGVMRITFLDVGQGDSALIEFPDKRVMLIDGGGTFSETFDMGRSVVAPYLWNRGIRKVDFVVSTHPQLDHVEGLIYTVDKFTIGEVWTSGRRGAAARAFDSMVQERGIREVIIHRDTGERRIGGCRVNFVSPPEDIKGNGYNINDLSIVMRLICEDVTFLFTGDIESKMMREIAARGGPLESTVIKVPHHGARGSVEESFISAVKPGIAVISAGYQNLYHHPSPETITAYERIGAAVYRTDIDGAVIVERKDGRLRVRTYEDMALKKVEFENLRTGFTTELSNLQKIWGD